MVKSTSFVCLALTMSTLIFPSYVLADDRPNYSNDTQIDSYQAFTGYRKEVELLNLQLDLNGIKMLDQTGVYPYKKGFERVTIFHIWAIECGISMDGLPSILRLAQEWSNNKHVKVIAVSETLDINRVRDFWLRVSRENRRKMSLAISGDSRIRDTIQTGVQPLTLLLDQDSVIRQAFAGSLKNRKIELNTAINRILQIKSAKISD